MEKIALLVAVGKIIRKNTTSSENLLRRQLTASPEAVEAVRKQFDLTVKKAVKLCELWRDAPPVLYDDIRIFAAGREKRKILDRWTNEKENFENVEFLRGYGTNFREITKLVKIEE